MPNAIFSNSVTNQTTGFARPGVFNGMPGTPAQQVHDGDTLKVELDGNVSIRLLGIDTPEVSFMFPAADTGFLSIEDPRWDAFLSDPLSDQWGPMQTQLPAALQSWLRARTGAGAVQAHRLHAAAATRELTAQVERDVAAMQSVPGYAFRYYMGFGFEVMDGYGRLLCILNRNQPDRSVPAPRPPSYNIRLLERGRAFPYFIWPNINPWNRPASVEEAVIPPGQAKVLAESDQELSHARQVFREARRKHLGVFDPMQPLLLEPFELRNLCRRTAPSRWLIDLSSDSDLVLHPLSYCSVPHPEDRLWIPAVWVPVFVAAGWKAQPDPSKATP